MSESPLLPEEESRTALWRHILGPASRAPAASAWWGPLVVIAVCGLVMALLSFVHR